MAVSLKSRQKKTDPIAVITPLVKAIVLAIPAVSSPDPIAGLKSGAGALNQIIDAAIAMKKDTATDLSFTAWDLVRASYAAGLTIFLARASLGRPPVGDELTTFVSDLLRRSDLLVEKGEYTINVESFSSPFLIPPIRDAATRLPRELTNFNPTSTPNETRRLFEASMLAGMRVVRDAKSESFKALESALSGPYAIAMDKTAALAQHRTFLIRSFTQVPIFGQELTGITVSNLYIRQRCYWYVKETLRERGKERIDNKDFDGSNTPSSSVRLRRITRLHIGDLHKTIHAWLAAKSSNDSVRVIAGGPGSGKSTFAKAISIEVIDGGLYDVLFVPLQEIDATGSFETRLANLFRNRSDLGFDRVESPTTWLARTQHDGSAPLRPLLMICDGLDEIAPPDSTESTNVTTDFIQSLNTWIGSRNAAGCYVKSIILGRNIAAKEAFGKLGIDDLALLNVGGLMPISDSEEWRRKNENSLVEDLDKLSTIDQRLQYWKNWAEFHNIDPDDVPEPLRSRTQSAAELRGLTAEPLLMYLLLWTGFLGTRWREAAENKNIVYEAIFKQIYQRDWGKAPGEIRTLNNREVGGHVGTRDMSFDDFMTLQEALGLASWQSGGRTVARAAFDRLIKFYIDPDMLDDLRKGPGISLKSVALQGYTRSAEDDAGYEFVHKSLSDYLIGRGLLQAINNSLNNLVKRISEERCRQSAVSLAQIAHIGAMSQEIATFFEDEIRLRYRADGSVLRLFTERYCPLCNWVLKNMFPVHEVDLLGKEVSFALYDQAERRAMDVFWSFGQSVSLLLYPDKSFHTTDEKAWKSGPVKLDWPLNTSFYSMFSRLSDRGHCADTGRMATFHRLDLSEQVFTDSSLGSVFYIAEAGLLRPSEWLSLKSNGSRFARASFYSANLLSSEISLCEFDDCNFNGTEMSLSTINRSSFVSCSFVGANIVEADFTRSYFSKCEFHNGNFTRCDFSDVSIVKSKMGKPDFPPRRGKMLPGTTTFDECKFTMAHFTEVEFGETRLIKANLEFARFNQCSLEQSILRNARFTNALLNNSKISSPQWKRIASSIDSTSNVDIIERSAGKVDRDETPAPESSDS